MSRNFVFVGCFVEIGLKRRYLFSLLELLDHEWSSYFSLKNVIVKDTFRERVRVVRQYTNFETL